MLRTLIVAVLATGASGCAQQSILGSDFLACFSTVEGAAGRSVVGVAGPGFTQALHIKTVGTSANPWDTRVRCFQTKPAKKNDTVLATFWMRATSAPNGTGAVTFVVEKGADPWTKSAEVTTTAGADWKKIEIPFSMAEDYDGRTAATRYNLSFWVNFENQEIEIGGFSILDYGANYSFWNLGLTNWPYDGWAQDAPWRKIAAERIEKIRKADIAVVVRDGQGRPVPNAAVHVQMKRHAFGFGSAVDGQKLTSAQPWGITLQEQQQYRDHILKMFNKVVLENDLKWPPWESWGRQSGPAAIEWLRANGITDIRGHNLIWPGVSYLPDDVKAALAAANVNKDWLRNRIFDHFTDILGVTKGKLTEWDVINEPVANQDVQKVLGDLEMVEWYKKAHELDPAAKLFVNDYNIVAARGMDIPHQNRYFDIIKFLIDNGAPLDGLGVQSHFDLNLTPPERVWSILDRFAQFGKAIEVTEFDVSASDERLKADYMRDFLTATFSHPAVTGFLMWGFWSKAHWSPEAALLGDNWEPRPNYDVWMQLTQKDWWTDVQGQTGADGVFRTRGFLGEYDVIVNGQTSPLKVECGHVNYALTGQQAPGAIAADGVVNAASFGKGQVAPGEIVEIWGTNYGSPAQVDGTYDGGQLLTFGGDTRVFFDGIRAPLIHTMRWDMDPNVGRVAAIVPYSASGSTKIEVEYLGTKTSAVTVPVAQAAPGIFSYSGGAGQAVAVNHHADRTVDFNKDTPLERGGYLEFFITGEGAMNQRGIDGKLPAYPNNPKPVLPVKVFIGGAESLQSDCPYNWVGQVYAGVTQVNACVPSTAPSGTVALEVRVGDVPAQAGVTVRVK